MSLQSLQDISLKTINVNLMVTLEGKLAHVDVPLGKILDPKLLP